MTRDQVRWIGAGLLALFLGGFLVYASAQTPSKTTADAPAPTNVSRTATSAASQDQFALTLDENGLRGNWRNANGEEGSLRVHIGDGQLRIRAEGVPPAPGEAAINEQTAPRHDGCAGGCRCCQTR